MRRRGFLRAAVVGGAASVALGFSVTRESIGGSGKTGPSPYGPLLEADANGIQLPANFTSRMIARSTEEVAGTGYTWHNAPDGGACYADGDGWIYVSNSEVILGAGGASAVKFDGAANITDAYSILSGTSRNCSGGATSWKTWLSCEETDLGYTWEADPWGEKDAIRREAIGRFKHEAAACDPDRKVIYLTEDTEDGCFYRFIPDIWEYLSAGTLQVLVESGDALSWVTLEDPQATETETRYQVSAAKHFDGGEGAYYRNGTCFFTTKGDNRVWAYHAENNTLAIAYDDDLNDNPPLSGVDNITGAPVGDLYVAEDGDNMEICIITPDDVVAPFLRVNDQSDSELCGVAFNPAGDRLYFSSQRGTSGSSFGGITYEVTGPFRTAP